MTRTDEIRQRLAFATPGPWSHSGGPVDGDGEWVWWTAEANADGGAIMHPVTSPAASKHVCEVLNTLADAEFIAHAHADIAWLLAELDARDERIALLRTEVSDLEGLVGK